MAACKVDTTKSPDFAYLCKKWRKQNYSSLDADIEAALAIITENYEASHCRRMQRFDDVLEGRLLLKYRFKNSSRSEGSRGGWRMIAIFDPPTRTLYPIMIYPKKEWELPGEEDLTRSVVNLAIALRQLNFPESPVQP